MVVQCSECQARYKYDESRFAGKRAKKIKCSKCGSIFEIVNPAFDTVPAEDISEIGDSTVARSSPQRKTSVHDPAQDTTKEMRVDPEMIASAASQVVTLFEQKKFSLAVISGPDSGRASFILEKPAITIGRAGADLTLSDTETSRQHCQLEVREDRVLLRDLDSTNGTWVNGEKVTADMPLQHLGEFTVGATTLMLIITDRD